MPTTIKVRGYHLDVHQHVNNAHYLEFLEDARWEWLGCSNAFSWMEENRLALIMVNINYRHPALLGDVLDISSQMLELGGKSGVVAQTVARASDKEIVADARLIFACVDLLTHKAKPIKRKLKQKMEEMLSG
ncbi:acyl-CoA thioesterase [Erwinia tracheiphila]|uniref:Thioesterase n=1 Tax=Erwinia tracheiphila TaxID=65700 RepID=A0A0M2K5F8_9GAMM|nr:thioesterase family protein [Erwinia tracheiphila]AXF74924.1 acyl-CoA thioesterase [Erwinia tracheiphila]EOS94286.1 hypothetical protein ETR_14666 [Erwinia tracheiphila PSU-1]KKF34199.1 thioesterase [Erwinia tracheiphila]UIA82537.1 acyl-CoA thioesterase [Erwinia tracheiphila]UIA89212.1 acyl-CoA thioesterase [Erwinia tracheiphila]